MKMVEPTERARFAGVTIATQPIVDNGAALFFVDVTPDEPNEADTVSVGWNGDRTKFGVYVGGKQVYPPEVFVGNDLNAVIVRAAEIAPEALESETPTLLSVLAAAVVELAAAVADMVEGDDDADG